MRYTPYTEAEIQSMNLIDEGTYPFEVIEVITTDQYNLPLRDKNGNDMAKLKLIIWDNQNRERTLYTFLSGDGNFAYKLRHFAKSIGMLAEYDMGTFDIEKTVGKSGKAQVSIRKGTLKADGSGEMWADRNDIKDFIVDQPKAAQAYAERGSTNIAEPSQVPQSADLDDDIPF